MSSAAASNDTAVPAAASGRTGRKRDASRDEDLCRAALALLAEVGYDLLSTDAVAARAGAGKATVYRRWSGKAELVVEAVSRLRGPVAEPDTGSLHGDLDALVRHFTTGDVPMETRVMAGLVPAVLRDDELRAAFMANFLAPRVRMFQNVYERAVARGELSARLDTALLAKVMPALVFQRVIMTGEPPDAAFARSVVDELILPMATAPRPAGPGPAPAPPPPVAAESEPFRSTSGAQGHD